MTPNTSWSNLDLSTFAATHDMFVAPFREDGTTPGTPTRIWSVVVDDNLFIRPASGPTSSWYAAAIAQAAGRITVAGTTHDVSFAAGSSNTFDDVDAAYALKYDTDPTSVAVMVGPGPRSATVKVSPR